MSASWLGAPPGGCPAPTRPRPSTMQCARWCVPRCSRAARSLVPVPVLQADTTYHRCARAYRTRPTSCRRRSRSASTSGRACCSTRSPTTIRRAAWWPLTSRRCRATRRTRRRGRGPRGQPATGWQVPSKWPSVLRTVFGVITVRGMDMSACDVIEGPIDGDKFCPRMSSSCQSSCPRCSPSTIGCWTTGASDRLACPYGRPALCLSVLCLLSLVSRLSLSGIPCPCLSLCVCLV